MKKARLFLALVFLASTLSACTTSITSPDDCCDINPGSNHCCN